MEHHQHSTFSSREWGPHPVHSHPGSGDSCRDQVTHTVAAAQCSLVPMPTEISTAYLQNENKTLDHFGQSSSSPNPSLNITLTIPLKKKHSALLSVISVLFKVLIICGWPYDDHWKHFFKITRAVEYLIFQTYAQHTQHKYPISIWIKLVYYLRVHSKISLSLSPLSLSDTHIYIYCQNILSHKHIVYRLYL